MGMSEDLQGEEAEHRSLPRHDGPPPPQHYPTEAIPPHRIPLTGDTTAERRRKCARLLLPCQCHSFRPPHARTQDSLCQVCHHMRQMCLADHHYSSTAVRDCRLRRQYSGNSATRSGSHSQRPGHRGTTRPRPRPPPPQGGMEGDLLSTTMHEQADGSSDGPLAMRSARAPVAAKQRARQYVPAGTCSAPPVGPSELRGAACQDILNFLFEFSTHPARIRPPQPTPCRRASPAQTMTGCSPHVVARDRATTGSCGSSSKPGTAPSPPAWASPGPRWPAGCDERLVR
jgi:hypothetical protein